MAPGVGSSLWGTMTNTRDERVMFCFLSKCEDMDGSTTFETDQKLLAK